MSRKLFFISALMCTVVLTGQGCPSDTPTDTETQPAPVPGGQQLPQQGTSERGDTSADQQQDGQEGASDQVEQPQEDASGEAALSEKEQQLVGTWRHTQIEGGISPGPVAPDVITWTFNADGTGTYYQDPEFVKAQEREINWKLDGNDILFTDESGAGSPTYRVDEWGEDKMRWHNYTLGDTYIVERE